MLYWFRTPPGVKVGRGAIDEEAIRLIEQHNPEIQFDWTSILREPPPPPQPRKDDRRAGRDRRGAPRETRPSAPVPRAATAHADRTQQVTASYRDEPASESTDAASAEAAEEAGAERHESPIELLEPGELTAPDSLERVEPLEPIELLEPAELLEREPLEPEPLEPLDRSEPPEPLASPSAAAVRLGSEGLARLRGRYAEVMARITERPLDEQTREELKQRAERLNPDTWVTSDEVVQALEVYESIYEGLRAVVGSGHRRRRGRGRRPADQKPQV